MKPAVQPFRRVLALALALTVASGLALAADKKDEKKPDDKKTPDTKKAADPKTAEKTAAPATNAVPLVVPFPKAVFSTALDTGKDPFFPASKRRFPKPPKPVEPPKPPPATTTNPVVIPPVALTNPPPATATNVVVAPPPPDLLGAANLSLRGLVGTKTRRFATVHSGVKSYDFAKGEEMLIRLPNEKQLKVRCIDIGERSAKFQVEGETQIKELFLREGL